MRGLPGASGLPFQMPAFLLGGSNSNTNNKANAYTFHFHLSLSRCCAECFTCIIAFNLHNKPKTLSCIVILSQLRETKAQRGYVICLTLPASKWQNETRTRVGLTPMPIS